MSSVDSVIRSVAPLQAGQLRIARLASDPFILQCISCSVYLAVNLNSIIYLHQVTPPSPRHAEFKFSVIEQEAIDTGEIVSPIFL